MIGWIVMYVVFGIVLLALSIFGTIVRGVGTFGGPEFSPTDGYVIAALMFGSAAIAAWSDWDCKRTMREYFGGD